MFPSKFNLHLWLLIAACLIAKTHQNSIEKPTEKEDAAVQSNSEESETSEPSAPEDQPLLQPSMRQNRMLSFWDYYNPPQYYTMPQPAFIPYPYYNPYEQYDEIPEDDYEMDIASRANIVKRRPGAKRRPQYQDSPIFYIRLPPTPYMFVPGTGYISQPTRFNPLIPPPMPAIPAPMPQMPPMQHIPQMQPMQPVPPMAQVPMSPFISIPLNFVSNARPTSVYHFGSGMRPPYVPQAPSIAPQYEIPAIPSYQPLRPARPTTSKPRPVLTDSEVTQLKGQFLFNGRPNQIYVLTNDPPNPVFTARMSPYY